MALPLFGIAQAEKPEYFIARGRIVNEDLNSIPGTYQMRASLWDNADAPEVWENNAPWVEYHVVQLLNDGLFEVRIGNQTDLPMPFDTSQYAFLQLDIRKGDLEYQTLDPRPLLNEIDRIDIITLPSKIKEGGPKAPVIKSNEKTLENVAVLNQNGELDDSVMPISIRTKLTSLQSDVVTVEEKTKENTAEINYLQEDIITLEKEWETRWDIAFSDNNDEIASLVTSLTSRTEKLESDVRQLKRADRALSKTLNDLPDLIEKNINDLAKETFATKEELAEISLSTDRNSVWKEVLHAGATLARNEDSSIGDIQFIVDEKKLAAFDGNTWNRLADQKDLAASLEKTIQKTFYYHDEIVKVDQNKSAQPGLFYWDKDKSTYFVGMADGSLRSLFAPTEGPSGPINETTDQNVSPVADWTDFRTADISSINIQKSEQTLVEQDSLYGLRIQSSKTRSNCSMALPEFTFHKNENKTYETVFYTGNMDGQILIGLMDGSTPPANKPLVQTADYSRMGLYMYLQEDSDLLYGENTNGISSYEIFEKNEQWKPNTFYRLSIKVQNSSEFSNLITVVEVSNDDFNTPIKTIVNHESQFDGLSETLKPYLFGTGQPDYSFVAFRTY